MGAAEDVVTVVRGAIEMRKTKKFKVWIHGKESEPSDFNYESTYPYTCRVAEAWAEENAPHLDEGDELCVYVRDDRGDLYVYTVDVEIERTYNAFLEKNPL